MEDISNLFDFTVLKGMWNLSLSFLIIISGYLFTNFLQIQSLVKTKHITPSVKTAWAVCLTTLPIALVFYFSGMATWQTCVATYGITTSFYQLILKMILDKLPFTKK